MSGSRPEGCVLTRGPATLSGRAQRRRRTSWGEVHGVQCSSSLAGLRPVLSGTPTSVTGPGAGKVEVVPASDGLDVARRGDEERLALSCDVTSARGSSTSRASHHSITSAAGDAGQAARREARACAARRRRRRRRWCRCPRRGCRPCWRRSPRSPPRSTAWASAITFSAYDVVLRPAVAPCSLRVHGTVDDRGRRAAAGVDRAPGDDQRGRAAAAARPHRVPARRV